jgi:hypothetical protein
MPKVKHQSEMDCRGGGPGGRRALRGEGQVDHVRRGGVGGAALAGVDPRGGLANIRVKGVTGQCSRLTSVNASGAETTLGMMKRACKGA